MASKTKTDKTQLAKRNEQGGKENYKKLIKEVSEVVPPYDEIDVQTTISYKSESPRGNAVRIITWASVGLLTLIGLYGTIASDRELLFAVLRAVEVTMAALMAGALGKMATRLLTRRGAEQDEKDEEDTG